MSNTTNNTPARVPPPTKHQLALMIWLCVFPTLTVINLAFGDWLRTMSPVLRTFVLATIAVPIVIYGLMPHLHGLRARLLSRDRQLQTGPSTEVVSGDTLTRAAFLDDEEYQGSNRRTGSMPLNQRSRRSGRTLENTRTAAPSGAQVAVREELP